MTAHELAKKLLEGPDLPVTSPGATGDHDEISAVTQDTGTFFDETFGRENGPHIHIS